MRYKVLKMSPGTNNVLTLYSPAGTNPYNLPAFFRKKVVRRGFFHDLTVGADSYNEFKSILTIIIKISL